MCVRAGEGEPSPKVDARRLKNDFCATSIRVSLRSSVSGGQERALDCEDPTWPFSVGDEDEKNPVASVRTPACSGEKTMARGRRGLSASVTISILIRSTAIRPHTTASWHERHFKMDSCFGMMNPWGTQMIEGILSTKRASITCYILQTITMSISIILMRQNLK